jgi:hypothetical protein
MGMVRVVAMNRRSAGLGGRGPMDRVASLCNGDAGDTGHPRPARVLRESRGRAENMTAFRLPTMRLRCGDWISTYVNLTRPSQRNPRALFAPII